MSATLLPLFLPDDPARLIAWRNGEGVSLAQFMRQAECVAQALPAGAAMISLCEDRYWFLVSYAAAALRGHTVLLPSSRAEQVVADVATAHAGSYCCDDGFVAAALSAGLSDEFPARRRAVGLSPDHIIMIGFTSGSTGEPKQFPKPWTSVSASTARGAAAIRSALDLAPDASAAIVATVPPQHMYGMELSVLMPLIGGMSVHAGRPLFPADIARALDEIPEPRVLVSTPVHLRAIIESSLTFPHAALIVSATAPLDQALARAVEEKLGGHLLEMFGSTETCVFATRRTAIEASWHLYEDVVLEPAQHGTLVHAPWYVEPVLLQDVVELQDTTHFVVRGRHSDMIEVAGKRASLADLTRRLLAIDGVIDAAVFQPEAQSGVIRRVAALVVAPGLTAQQVLEQLRPGVDPAFLPRPLRIVGRLPRNELGKLPRDKLVAMLRTP